VQNSAFRELAGNNIPVLRRIFARIQGATMCAYCIFVHCRNAEYGQKDK